MTTSGLAPHADNGGNVDALPTARAALTEAPEGARFNWRATGRWVKGTHSHAVVDGSYRLGAEQRHRRSVEFDSDHQETFAAADVNRTTIVRSAARWGASAMAFTLSLAHPAFANQWATEGNVALNGTNLTYYAQPYQGQCLATCASNASCRGATWIQAGTFKPGDSAMCYLLSAVTGRVSVRGHYSMVKATTPSLPATGINGRWRLATNCKYADGQNWAALMNISMTGDGSLQASTSNDPLNVESEGGNLAGNAFSLVLHPKTWASNLTFSGTASGAIINGSVHHYGNDDCNFSMTR